MPDFRIVFYKDSKGFSQVEEFLDSLDFNQKTPRSEILKAKQYRADYLSRLENEDER